MIKYLGKYDHPMHAPEIVAKVNTPERAKKISRSWQEKFKNGYKIPHSQIMKMVAAQKPWTLERKAKAALIFTGENNPKWKGGSKGTMRRYAITRDNFTCQKCGMKEPMPGFMDIDHIKPKTKFPELKRVLDNLLTLCPNCHRIKSLTNKEL